MLKYFSYIVAASFVDGGNQSICTHVYLKKTNSHCVGYNDSLN